MQRWSQEHTHILYTYLWEDNLLFFKISFRIFYYLVTYVLLVCYMSINVINTATYLINILYLSMSIRWNIYWKKHQDQMILRRNTEEKQGTQNITNHFHFLKFNNWCTWHQLYTYKSFKCVCTKYICPETCLLSLNIPITNSIITNLQIGKWRKA